MNLRASRLVALDTAIRALAAGSGLGDTDVVEVLASIADDLVDDEDEDDLVVDDGATGPPPLVH